MVANLGNFGVLRNTNTMELTSVAPIYDSGNSMFFLDLINRPFTRMELLERKITAFYETEEKMLKKVKNKNLIKIDLLPVAKEVSDFYKRNGIPEHRADIIADNYDIKLKMLDEFQHGKTISLYKEKHKQK